MKLVPFSKKIILIVGLSALFTNVQATTRSELLQSKLNLLVSQELGEVNKQMGIVINLAGRQRMLTQKMSKEVLLVYLGVDKKTNRTNLGKSAVTFAITLKGLINGSKDLGLKATQDKDILKQVDIVSGQWIDFAKNIIPAIKGSKLDLPFIENISKQNLPLLNEMDKAVSMYEKNAGADLNDFAAVVNLSGRQRMLTQKMTKEYLLIAADVDVKGNKKNLKSTIALFDQTLKNLRDGNPSQGLSKTTEPRIREQLASVDKLWQEYKTVLKTMDFSKAGLEKVATLNLPLLKKMNTAVKMYEELSDKA